MAVTMEDVRAILGPEEVDYARGAAQLGVAALPYLLQLVQGSDVMLASKAAYLAAGIDHPDSDRVLEAVSQRSEAVLRVAAAGAASKRKQPPLAVVRGLLTDSDAGVRKVALRTVELKSMAALKPVVQSLAAGDSEVVLRSMAQRVVSSL